MYCVQEVLVPTMAQHSTHCHGEAWTCSCTGHLEIARLSWTVFGLCRDIKSWEAKPFCSGLLTPLRTGKNEGQIQELRQ